MGHAKEEREILTQLRAQGWRTERTTGGHYKCYPPAGLLPPERSREHVLFALGAGGSGYRNAVSRLKRSGFILGLYEPVQVGAQAAHDDSLLDATGIVQRSNGDAAPANALPSLLIGAAKRPCAVCGAIELVRGECCPAPDGSTYGEALRILRQEEGIRQADLADIIETTQPQICRIECNAIVPTAAESAALQELFPRLRLAPSPAVVEGTTDAWERVLDEPEIETASDGEASDLDAPPAEAPTAMVPPPPVSSAPSSEALPSDPIEELWALLALVGDLIVSINARRVKNENGKVRWEVTVDRLRPAPSRTGEGASVRNACMSIAREVTSQAEAEQRQAEAQAAAAASAASRLRAISQRIAS